MVGAVGVERPKALVRDFEALEDFTCDAPMCDPHSFIVGVIFDIPEPGVNPIDHCLIHREMGTWTEGCKDLLTEEAAARRRAKVREELAKVVVRKSEDQG
jgi:hypothetical protein